MKKLLSTTLVVIIMLSAIIIMPNAVSAATKTKKTNKTFYPVSHSLCGNSYGYVTLDEDNLILVQKSKGYIDKTVNYIERKSRRYSSAGSAGDRSFFMRGKTVIYYDDEYTYSVNLDGTNRKKLIKHKNNYSTYYLLGGYGKDVISMEIIGDQYWNTKKVNVYKVNTAGKITKLITLPKKYIQISLFGSKIYCKSYKDNKMKVYNLETNKTTTGSKYDYKYGKKNMYYINKNNNLVRVDLNGKKKTVAKNVYDILDVNNGSTVLYSKLDKSKKEIYYRQTGDKKGKKISSFEKLAKAAVSSFNYYEDDPYHCKTKIETSSISKGDVKAKIVGKRVAFSVYTCTYHGPIILSLGINGGAFITERSAECYGGYYGDEDEPFAYEYFNLESVGNTLAFRCYDTADDIFCGVEYEEIEN